MKHLQEPVKLVSGPGWAGQRKGAGMADVIKEYWALIVGGIAGLVWLVRLEARGLNNEREIKRLWETRDEDKEDNKAHRAELMQELREMRNDIKELVKMGSRNV